MFQAEKQNDRQPGEFITRRDAKQNNNKKMLKKVLTTDGQ